MSVISRTTHVEEEPVETTREEEFLTKDRFEQIKREGRIRVITYSRLNELGWKLLSRERGSFYEPIPLSRELTQYEKQRHDYDDLKSDPSDRVHLYVEYIGSVTFKLYIAKVRFGKELPMQPVTLEVLS